MRADAMPRDTVEEPLAVELHGVRLHLHATAPDFMAYAANVLASVLPATPGAPMIVSHLEWVDRPPSTELRTAFGEVAWDRRPGRDLYLAGNAAYWLRIDDFANLQLAISWIDGRLEVAGRFHFQLGKDPRLEPLRRWRHRKRMEALRAHRFSTLAYYLGYYPILWWLSRFHGWHVLHGAAVCRQRRAYVFAGLPGCGKSTLAVSALGLPEVEMMSDNLVLTNGTSIRACPESLLLDEASAARVGKGAARLVKTGERRVYGRDAYRPDRVELGEVEPRAVFAVGRAGRGSLRRMDADTAVARIEAGNILAKEVRRLHVMGNVIDLVAGTRAPDVRAAVTALASVVPCYELWVGPDEALSDVIERRVLTAAQGTSEAQG